MCNSGNDPASRTTAQHVMSLGKDPIPFAKDPMSSPRMSTVEHDDEPRYVRIHHDRRYSDHTARSSRRDSRQSSSRIKHDESTDKDSYRSISDDEGRHSLTISFHQRRKALKYRGLDRLVPSDERLERLMSYRYYWLINTRPIREHQSAKGHQKTMNNIELTMHDHNFSGEYPVLVFDFLTRVVELADMTNDE